MQKTYTLAMATRLKKRIFCAGAIREEFCQRLADALGVFSVHIQSLDCLDYGFILVYSSEESPEASRLASRIRYATSGPLREVFPELWSIPSLWTKRFYHSAGDKRGGEELTIFFDTIRSR